MLTQNTPSSFRPIVYGIKKLLITFIFIVFCTFLQPVISPPACSCATGPTVTYTDTSAVEWYHCLGAGCAGGCISRHYHPSIPGLTCIDQCEPQCVTNCNICATSTTCSSCLSGYALMSST